jgi:hypothetical protein
MHESQEQPAASVRTCFSYAASGRRRYGITAEESQTAEEALATFALYELQGQHLGFLPREMQQLRGDLISPGSIAIF